MAVHHHLYKKCIRCWMNSSEKSYWLLAASIPCQLYQLFQLHSMKQQNYKNHTQIVYDYYLMTGVPIIILTVIAIFKLFSSVKADQNFGIILVLISWIFWTMLFKSRGFALKAQDRAIRAEENLRYY